ncbi:MAG: DUF1801 domain-containing protein [Acidovorax sp.]|uniref:DUF1801 domain-containing protein n=1 Tax=Acidovorax sp. TaxID=1872122 RepID=UPI0022C17C79|nr:DUF1801 domain-containing protein [Acidovorax sp.]MCZ8219296.1 DUF1801 domain-containing protein [Acidovorax sp.]
MATRSVPALLEDIRFLGETQYAIVQAVRALVLQPPFEAPTEEVKYGGILFAAQGVSFCGVFAYQGHVSVEFGQGARISDPLGHLEGAGKGRRHLKLRSIDDLAHKQLAQYLPLALEAARANT